MDQPTALVLVGICTAIPAMYATKIQGGRSKDRQAEIKQVVDDVYAQITARRPMPMSDVLDALEARVEDGPNGRTLTVMLPEHAQVVIPERRHRDQPVAVERRKAR